MPFALTITNAGFDALVNAQNGATEAIRIVELGLTGADFVVAPTLTALPGEFKRLESFAGQSVSDKIIHMTAADNTADVYDLRGLGFYLEDGTLFAVYGQPEPIFRKVNIASFLTAFDVAFDSNVQGSISFGDSAFLYPPATETVKGVAELATQAETQTGTDAERIVTPATLKTVLDALASTLGTDIDTLQAALDALQARTITGSGLVTGGGNLTASRTLAVAAASVAEALAGTRNDVALTPASLGSFKSAFAQTDWIRLPGGLILQWGRFTANSNSTTAVTFPLAFPSACCSVVAGGAPVGGADSQDNTPGVVTSTISATGFSVFSADDNTAGCTYIAVGY